MAAGAPHGLRAQVTKVLEPVVAAAGCDLEDVTVSPAGRRTVVRVVVDADGGITLDRLAEVSRALSEALDRAETAGGGPVGQTPYTLEVTSPGVDRPLTLPRHWRRNVGRLVTVAVSEAEGDRSVTGRVLEATDDGVTLDVDGVEHQVPYGRLGSGSVQVEFSRPRAATGTGAASPAPEGDEE